MDKTNETPANLLRNVRAWSWRVKNLDPDDEGRIHLAEELGELLVCITQQRNLHGKDNPHLADANARLDDAMERFAQRWKKPRATRTTEPTPPTVLTKATPEALGQFWDRLTRFDWWYQYSDDHRVYSRGRDERERIEAHARVLGQPGQDLLTAYKDHVRSPKVIPKPERPSAA